MRTYGWCYKCRHFKWVRVSHPSAGIAHGLCSACEEALR